MQRPRRWLRSSAGRLGSITRRRRTRTGPGVAAISGQRDRCATAATRTHLAGENGDRPSGHRGDDREQRLFECEGENGARLAPSLSELAHGLHRGSRVLGGVESSGDQFRGAGDRSAADLVLGRYVRTALQCIVGGLMGALRLEPFLGVIRHLGYPDYFMTILGVGYVLAGLPFSHRGSAT